MRTWLKENIHYVMAFLLPVVILLIAYATFYVYPFGNGSVLVLDLNGQYVSYFEQFRNAFFAGKSLLYSWSSSLGGEFLGTSAYYLLSPFSFLTLIFPANHITEAILMMSVCKLGCASLMMCIYLRKHDVSKLYSLLLGICYGLSGYAVVQVMNIMWMDAVLMLPIFILSIERLVDEKNYGLFVFTLVYLFITNYYIAYMIGLFGGLYFFYYSILKKSSLKMFGSDFAHFIGYTAICVLLCSWLLLPTIYSLSLGKSTFTSPDYSLYVKFDLLDFFVKMLPSTYDSVNVQGLPFVYSGLLSLLLVPLYFLNGKVDVKAKICNIALLVIVMLCMNISWIDLALHGFQNPNWLNYRYAFVYPFLMLRLAGEAVANKDGYSAKNILGVFFGLFFAMIYIQKYGFYYVDDMFTIILGIVLLCIYAILLMNEPKRLVSILLVLTCSLELVSNTYTCIHDLDDEVLYSSRDSYIPFMEELKDAYASIREYDTTLLYRVEKTFHRTVNDPMSVGYAGISHSTSSLNKESIALIKRFGYAARDHWTKYLGGTPISDSILGIKYVMAKGSAVPYYTFLYSNENISVYKNTTALSILTSVANDVETMDMNQSSPFVLQNELLSRMLGIKYTEFFEPLEINSITLENAQTQEIAGHTRYSVIDSGANSEIFFNFTSSNGRRVFYYFPSSYPREVNMWFNEGWVDTYFGNESTRIYDLGYVEDGDSLGMTIINSDVYLRNDVDYFYTFNEELFNSYMQQLLKKTSIIHSFDETSLHATVKSDEDDIIMTSIPYEKGWSIYVDGEKVEYYEILEGFIGFDVGEGSHEIEMRFSPYGYHLGWLLAIFALIILGILQYHDNEVFRKFLKQKLKTMKKGN